jgi:nucleotide-binding universal stress UspA family protein
MGYQNILVPLDGSEFSEAVLKHVDRIANPGSKIHLLSVVPELVAERVMGAPELWEDPSQELETRNTYLNRVAESLQERGYQVTCEVREGRVVNTIAQATQHNCDVVIMATHRRTGLGKFILGSVSQDLLHKAHCPVLIV